MAQNTSIAVPHVFAAIDRVRQQINKLGIEKDREVTDGVRFKFRGIDDVLDTFSGPMADAGLMMFPSYDGITTTERKTANNKSNYNTVVRGSYRLVSTMDGSGVDVGSFYGEANDTQDKSVAKAQSIALRQAYLQTFVVPLGADMDPEADREQTEEPQRPAGDGKPNPRVVEGQHIPADEVSDDTPPYKPITDAQKRMIAQKLRSAGISDAEFMTGFGVATGDNINQAFDWIKRQRSAKN